MTAVLLHVCRNSQSALLWRLAESVYNCAGWLFIAVFPACIKTLFSLTVCPVLRPSCQCCLCSDPVVTIWRTDSVVTGWLVLDHVVTVQPFLTHSRQLPDFFSTAVCHSALDTKILWCSQCGPKFDNYPPYSATRSFFFPLQISVYDSGYFCAF